MHKNTKEAAKICLIRQRVYEEAVARGERDVSEIQQKESAYGSSMERLAEAVRKEVPKASFEEILQRMEKILQKVAQENPRFSPASRLGSSPLSQLSGKHAAAAKPTPSKRA